MLTKAVLAADSGFTLGFHPDIYTVNKKELLLWHVMTLEA